MASQLVLAGYYGHGNWGDEASLAALLQILSREEVCVLSGRPEWTRAQYGVESVPRLQMGAVYRTVRGASALLLGGGSLLQDATSLRSLLYYLTLIRWGMQASGRVALIAQGVGPLRRSVSKRLVRWALRDVPFITVRDPESARLLQSLGVKQPIGVYADLAYALELQKDHPVATVPSRTPFVGLAPRTWRDQPVQAAFAGFAHWLLEQGFIPVFVPMQEPEDRRLCDSVVQTVGSTPWGTPLVLTEQGGLEQLLASFAALSAMVAMRLHAAIFASHLGIPILTVAYDPKVVALCQILQTPPPLSLTELTAQHLIQAWDSFWSQREGWIERLKGRVPALRQAAKECLRRVREWLPN